MKVQNLDFDLKEVTCSGIEVCKVALLKKSKNVLDANFIEGMACVRGCIGGAGCLTYGEKIRQTWISMAKKLMKKQFPTLFQC